MKKCPRCVWSGGPRRGKKGNVWFDPTIMPHIPPTLLEMEAVEVYRVALVSTVGTLLCVMWMAIVCCWPAQQVAPGGYKCGVRHT